MSKGTPVTGQGALPALRGDEPGQILASSVEALSGQSWLTGARSHSAISAGLPPR